MNIAIGAVACTAITSILFFLFSRLINLRHNLPPGPAGKWIVGNLSDFLSDYQWIRFSKWSNTFGGVVYMTVLGQPIVILNKFEHARELMDKHGGLNSDRPRMTYIVDMLKIRSVTFMPYGDLWRTHRKLMQQYLNPRAVITFRPLQARCVLGLLEDLLEKPDTFWKHVKRFAASAVLSATYGYTVAHEDDPLIKLNEHSDRAIIGAGPPGATLVDFFPILRFMPSFFPGSSFKKIALRAQPALHEMADRPYQMVKEERAAGRAVPSLLSRMLDDFERQGIVDEAHHEAIKDVCGSMYRAGVATTSATLYVFILAIVLHPHVARKAQVELDSVLKGERLPSFEDQDVLPYISCIMKECLRWAPPFPLGIAHRALEDSELEGKHIPKGCLIMPNIWHMMHDERNYSDPEIFNPDRFLTNNSASPVLDPTAAIFGFGRRICPGRHFAEADLWLAMASILAVFDILPEEDEGGHQTFPRAEYTPGLNSLPKEFSCRILPRNEKATVLLKTAVGDSLSYT